MKHLVHRLRRASAPVLLAVLLLPTVAVAAPRKHTAPHQAPAQDPVAVAVDHLRNLEYDPAQVLLDGFLKEHPDDLHGLNLLGTVILYREMFQRGLLESHLYGKKGEAFNPTTTPVTDEFQKQLFDVLDKAQSLADERVQKDANDKEALYWSGVTHGTRGTYLFAVKRSYSAALGEAKAANKQHKALLKLDPAFVDANMIVGVQDYVVGSLPWIIKVLAALAGAHGNREQGLREIELVAQKGNYARDDARTVLAVLYQREERWADARRVLEELVRRFPRGFLSAQELGAVCTRLEDFRCAASTYDVLLEKYHAGPPNSAWKRFWVAKALYLSGQAHERLGETDLALARYDEGAKLKDQDRYIPRCDLAAADLLARTNRMDQARPRYEQLAASYPGSDEAKAAKKALER
ncbi:MAG: tetratricopeptide repeat protein [Acidobacteriia bacterium]|nr:tetratricopeptide repeat protein [Terriglobia bacterium]